MLGAAHSTDGADPSANGGDSTDDPDAVACLRVAGSALASLRGLDGFRNLLALAVPRSGLCGLDCQVCRCGRQQS